LKKIENNDNKTKNIIKTTSKNSMIVPKFVGITLQIYNGKTFITIKIIEEMINHKLGEFISTRKQFSYKINESGAKNRRTYFSIRYSSKKLGTKIY
jgi:small subunit ribosomal protein S19